MFFSFQVWNWPHPRHPTLTSIYRQSALFTINNSRSTCNWSIALSMIPNIGEPSLFLPYKDFLKAYIPKVLFQIYSCLKYAHRAPLRSTLCPIQLTKISFVLFFPHSNKAWQSQIRHSISTTAVSISMELYFKRHLIHRLPW